MAVPLNAEQRSLVFSQEDICHSLIKLKLIQHRGLGLYIYVFNDMLNPWELLGGACVKKKDDKAERLLPSGLEKPVQDIEAF